MQIKPGQTPPQAQQPTTVGTPFPTRTKEIRALLERTAPRAELIHKVPGTQTWRKLVLLKDKLTGKPVRSFYFVFVSMERQVGATEYCLANRDGTFRTCLDDTFDGKPVIDRYSRKNAHLKVVWENGLPTIKNVHLIRHGDTKYAIADLSFGQRESKLVGIEHDSADPAYSKPISIRYTRAKSLEKPELRGRY